MSRSYPATPRADVYSRITTEIVSAIEAGAGVRQIMAEFGIGYTRAKRYMEELS